LNGIYQLMNEVNVAVAVFGPSGLRFFSFLLLSSSPPGYFSLRRGSEPWHGSIIQKNMRIQLKKKLGGPRLPRTMLYLAC
jgi:hypothetical protein